METPATTFNSSAEDHKGSLPVDASLPADLRQKVDPFGLGELAELLSKWEDRHSPNKIERAHLLNLAFFKLEDLVRMGAPERAMKARQLFWLLKEVPALGPNEAALRRNYNRLLAQWRKGGRKFAAIYGGREKAARKRKAPKLPVSDVELLAIAAVHDHGDSLKGAWATRWHELTQETRGRFPLGNGYYVPAKVRQQVAPRIRRLSDHHKGWRTARANGAFGHIDYGKSRAGDVTSQDETTADVYCYRSEQPTNLFRPQLILQIDVISGFIFNFALEESKAMTAVTALGLLRRKLAHWGPSYEGELWERGKYKDAKILGKGGIVNLLTEDRETIADRLGIRIAHAWSARGKAIMERVFGTVNGMLAGCPGYVGSDEMHLKYESVRKAKKEVEAGAKHPAEAGFLEIDQLTEYIAGLIHKYHRTPGRRKPTGNLIISPQEALEKFWRRNERGEPRERVPLDPGLLFLLAGYIEVVRVGRGGISLFGGKYRYYNEDTGAVEGEQIKVYLDPENPESISFTDLDGDNVRTVPLLPKIPAFGATPEELEAGLSPVMAHEGAQQRHYRELASKYCPPAGRVHLSAETKQKVDAMMTQRRELAQEAKARAADATKAECDARARELEQRLARAEVIERDAGIYWPETSHDAGQRENLIGI